MTAGATPPADDRAVVLQVVEGTFASSYFADVAAGLDEVRTIFAMTAPVAPECAAALRAAGAEVVEVGPPFSPCTALRLARTIRRTRADLIHTHLFLPSLLGMAVASLFPRVRRVMTRHYADAHHRLDRPVHRLLDRWLVRRAHIVVANSAWTARVVVELDGGDPSRVLTIPFAVAPEVPLLPWPPVEQPTIAIVGRLDPVKGHDTLLRSLVTLGERGVTPHLLVAGDGPLRQAMTDRALALDLADQVSFLGFVENVTEVYARASLLVVPSVEEAFGQVAMEAMAAGRPVIASRVGGLPELVADGDTGWLVPPGDVDALATAIEAAVADVPALRSMGMAARRRMLERYSLCGMIEQHRRLYLDGNGSAQPVP